MSELKARVKSLTSRLDEFRGQQKKLNRKQDAFENEMLELRSKLALEDLTESEQLRLDSLRDQSNNVASDLREILRLKKLTDAALSAEQDKLEAETKASSRKKAVRVRDLAKSRLDESRDALREAAATFAADWATANEETPYIGASTELISRQLDARGHATLVEDKYKGLTNG